MELYLIRHGQSFNNTLPDGDGRVVPHSHSNICEGSLFTTLQPGELVVCGSACYDASLCAFPAF